MPATTRRQSGKVVSPVKMVPTTVTVAKTSTPVRGQKVATSRTGSKKTAPKSAKSTPATVKKIATTATAMDVDGSDLSELSASEDEESQEPKEEEEEEEYWDEEENVEEEEESDYGDEPAPKRRKTGAKPSKSSKAKSSYSKDLTMTKGPSRRVQGRLQNMLEMPLDVLFLIFYDLLPQDLLNLARTSKNLRAVLMSRNAISAWKAARANAPGLPAPEPPSDMSEPAWAHLLYGGAVCWTCEAKNIHRIDFALRRRMCTKCMKANLVYASKFRAKCPDLESTLMDFLPYTHTGGWAHGHSSGSRFYWRPDLYAMRTKVVELQKNIKLNTPGARKAYEDFRKERILYVDSILQGVNDLEKWVKESEDDRVNGRQDRMVKRYEDIVERLTALGYEEDELDDWYFQHLSGVRNDRELTDASWKKLRPSLEEWLMNQRVKKYEEKRRQVAAERMGKAAPIYLSFLRTLLPIQLFLVPSLDSVTTMTVELPCINQLVKSDPDVQVTRAEWDNVANALPATVSEWILKTMKDISAKMPQPLPIPSSVELVTLSSSNINAVRQGQVASSLGATDLATTVFTCGFRNDVVIIGREVIHAMKNKDPAMLFSERGAKAARDVIQLEKMDATATATELDRRDSLFRCLRCDAIGAAPKEGLESAFTWRGCVEHFISASHEGHPEPCFQMLSPEDASKFPARRVPGLGYARYNNIERSWMCNHCPANQCKIIHSGWTNSYPHTSRNVQNYQEVVAHLRSAHDVRVPVEDVDLFFLPAFGERALRVNVVKLAPPPAPAGLPSTPQASSSNAQASSSKVPQTNVRCLHCKGGKGERRLFILDAVRSHIRAKHDNTKTQIELGVDYERIA